MPAGSPSKRSALKRLRDWYNGPETQASLFHYILKEDEQSGVMSDFWNILRHPIRTFLEEIKAPPTQASLFGYLKRPEDSAPLDWKDLLKSLFTEYKNALFIPSIWSNQQELVEERAELRTRRMESGVVSMVIHGLIIGTMFVMAFHKITDEPKKDEVVFVNTPMNLPVEGVGGGGGGGGRHEPLPAPAGRMPDVSRVQYMPPDPAK